MTCFIPAPAQWVATGKAFMINSVHKHIGEECVGVGRDLLYIGILNAVTSIQLNYFFTIALN